MITQSHKTNKREKNQSGDWNNNGEIVSQFPLDFHLKEETRNIGNLSVSRSHSHAKDMASLNQHGGDREPLIGENLFSENSLLKTLTQMQQAIASEKKAAITFNAQFPVSRSNTSRGKEVLIEKSSLEEGLNHVSPKTPSVLSTEHAATASVQEGLSLGQGSGVKEKNESACQSRLLWETASSIENREHPLNILGDHFNNANNLLHSIYKEITQRISHNPTSISEIENYFKDEKNVESQKIVETAQEDVRTIVGAYNEQALAPILLVLKEFLEELNCRLDKKNRFKTSHADVPEVEVLVNEVKYAQKFDRILIGFETLNDVIGFSKRDAEAFQDQQRSIQILKEKIHSIYSEDPIPTLIKYNESLKQVVAKIYGEDKKMEIFRSEKIKEILSKYDAPDWNSPSREASEAASRRRGEDLLTRTMSAYNFFYELREYFHSKKNNPKQSLELCKDILKEINEILSADHLGNLRSLLPDNSRLVLSAQYLSSQISPNLGSILKTDLIHLKGIFDRFIKNYDENKSKKIVKSEIRVNSELSALIEKYLRASRYRIEKYDLSEQGLVNFARLVMQAIEDLKSGATLSEALVGSHSQYKAEMIDPESPRFDPYVVFKVIWLKTETPKAAQILQDHMIYMVTLKAEEDPRIKERVYSGYYGFIEESIGRGSETGYRYDYERYYDSNSLKKGREKERDNSMSLSSTAKFLIGQHFYFLSSQNLYPKGTKCRCREAFRSALLFLNPQKNRNQWSFSQLPYFLQLPYLSYIAISQKWVSDMTPKNNEDIHSNEESSNSLRHHKSLIQSVNKVSETERSSIENDVESSRSVNSSKGFQCN